MGSPPHMRGKALVYDQLRVNFGITPAHAGKRMNFALPPYIGWDHPRTCGEKFYDDEGIKLALGSPPHMRGKAKNGKKLHL